MAENILVYYHGVIGVPGKGPNWIEKYNPSTTIGSIIQKMTSAKLGYQNKRIEIFKFQKGDLNKFDKNNLYWNHNTKMSEYLNTMGLNGKDLFLVYVCV